MNFENKQSEENIEEYEYFKSNADKYIFTLLKLDGEKRAELLGITEELYYNKKKAREWLASLSKQIHPDRCKIKGSADAMAKLNTLYAGMTGKGV